LTERYPEVEEVNYVVLFMPDQQLATVEDGETLLTAAQRADVYINSICGGEGLCGKCRLILKRGQVESQPTALLTREEIQKGYVLVCQTRVHPDVVAEVPPESRLEGRPQLVKEEANCFVGVAPRREGAKVYPFDRSQVHERFHPLIVHPSHRRGEVPLGGHTAGMIL